MSEGYAEKWIAEIDPERDAKVAIVGTVIHVDEGTGIIRIDDGSGEADVISPQAGFKVGEKVRVLASVLPTKELKAIAIQRVDELDGKLYKAYMELKKAFKE